MKLLDIKYLCVDEDAETIEYVLQSDHYVVGTYKDGRLFILLFDGKPKHHQIKGFEQGREEYCYRVVLIALINSN